MRKLLKKQGYVPTSIVTDKLRSYGATLRDLGMSRRHETGAGLARTITVSTVAAHNLAVVTSADAALLRAAALLRELLGTGAA